MKALISTLHFVLLYHLPIEEFWPENNASVNYPIKVILVERDNDQVIDMKCVLQQFCVSYVACLAAEFGLQKLFSSCNEHAIPGTPKFSKTFRLSMMENTQRNT